MLVSVDGYFEAPNHDISWHNVDADFNTFAIEQLREIGMLVFGHTTYNLMANFWPTPQGISENATIAKLMNETPKIAVSHEPFQADWSNTTVIHENVADTIKELKAKPGKDMAIFGSNALCVSLMEAGLVDEFRIMVCPVALGKGTSLFAGLSKRINFQLAKQHKFESGNLLQYYTVGS